MSCLPTVPLPPSWMRPNRRKGTERVRMSGVTFRITITFSGSEGMSLVHDGDIVWFWEVPDSQLFEAAYNLRGRKNCRSVFVKLAMRYGLSLYIRPLGLLYLIRDL